MFTTKKNHPSPSYVIVTPHNYSKTMTVKRLNSSGSLIHCPLAVKDYWVLSGQLYDVQDSAMCRCEAVVYGR